MKKIEIIVTDNEAIMSIPMGNDMYSNSLIITKETFIECYEKWVKPIELKDEVARNETTRHTASGTRQAE